MSPAPISANTKPKSKVNQNPSIILVSSAASKVDNGIHKTEAFAPPEPQTQIPPGSVNGVV